MAAFLVLRRKWSKMLNVKSIFKFITLDEFLLIHSWCYTCCHFRGGFAQRAVKEWIIENSLEKLIFGQVFFAMFFKMHILILVLFSKMVNFCPSELCLAYKWQNFPQSPNIECWSKCLPMGTSLENSRIMHWVWI